jgi:signal transduction histidine kinase/CheY-like chemotaxis protein
VDVADVSQLPPEAAPLAHALMSYGVRSALTIPVIHEGFLIGGLGLFAQGQNRWPDEYRTLLTMVAHVLCNVLARRDAEQERQNLHTQFLQAQKMEAVGRLTAGVAHDFNNLLTVISGHAELLRSRLLPSDPHRQSAEKITLAGWRAADLTRQLLIFSRKQVTQQQALNVNAAVTETGQMLHRIIGEDIELTTILAADLWTVQADPTQIGQVIINLSTNARDAMPGGGQLTMETANVVLDSDYASIHLGVRPGEYVMLAVSDTGVGMTEEVKSHLFEPFFTTKEAGKGTGLGLPAVHGIVRQSGGHIWVYSEPGQGTTFKIYLPRTDKVAVAPTRTLAGGELLRGTETVLLVEDDRDVRDMFRGQLEDLGYRVLEASNANQAFKKVAEYMGDIQLLVTDVVLPGMNGKQLSEDLCEICPGMKVLFVSGYTDNVIAHHGVLDRGIAFLEKPFSCASLARKIREVLDGPEDTQTDST